MIHVGRRLLTVPRLAIVSLAIAVLGGQLSCTSSSSGPSTSAHADPSTECTTPGGCGSGKTCHVDNDDLCGGYCSPPCSQCPAGAVCKDDICFAPCTVDTDCPRSYQLCKDGACSSDKNNCP